MSGGGRLIPDSMVDQITDYANRPSWRDALGHPDLLPPPRWWVIQAKWSALTYRIQVAWRVLRGTHDCERYW